MRKITISIFAAAILLMGIGVLREGNQITEEVFSDYDVTIVNFWNNG